MSEIPLMHGVCSHCGTEDTGSDEWQVFDFTIAPGPRGPRRMASTPTELAAYEICPECRDSDWGAALRDVLAHPGQNTIETYDRCTVLCTHRPLKRRRGQGVLLGRRTRTTCPSCWNRADIEILHDYEPRPGILARFLLRTLPDPRKWAKKGIVSPGKGFN